MPDPSASKGSTTVAAKRVTSLNGKADLAQPCLEPLLKRRMVEGQLEQGGCGPAALDRPDEQVRGEGSCIAHHASTDEAAIGSGQTSPPPASTCPL